MKKFKLILVVQAALMASSLIFSCNNEGKTDPGNKADSVSKMPEAKDSGSSLLTDTAVAINHLLMKQYLPVSIPGFKTVGYPDTLDRFTGEPTGETASNFTSGGKLSFIKHLYQQGEKDVAVEIIDYKTALPAYQGLYRMFDMDHLQQTEEQKVEFVDTGIPGVKAKLFHIKADNTTTVRAFVCDRFIVNVQVVNAGSPIAISALKAINLRQLMADYCKQR